jgi:hypothetical protein
MALDFPSAPTNGQKYPVTPVVGMPQYTWDGEKWTTVGPQITSAPPSTTPPLMDQPQAAVGIGSKYAREDHVHPKIYAAPFDVMAYSGIQLNGSMDVSQERGYVSGMTTGGKYICDGWAMQKNGGGTFDAGIYDIGYPGLQKVLLVQTQGITTPAATDFYFVNQFIEGYRIARLNWGNVGAKGLTLGFWTAHSKPGVYGGSVRNGDVSRSLTFTYTQNAGGDYEFKTIFVPGCTDGVWKVNNETGINLSFTIACGSSYISPQNGVWTSNPASYLTGPGQVNGMDTTLNCFRLTGVIVLPGVDETPTPERARQILRPYDQELAACQRYYCKSFDAAAPVANNSVPIMRYVSIAEATTAVDTQRFFFPVEMRVTPTVRTFSPAQNAPVDGQWQIFSGVGFQNSTSITIIGATPKGFTPALQGLSGLTFGSSYLAYGNWTADARY